MQPTNTNKNNTRNIPNTRRKYYNNSNRQVYNRNRTYNVLIPRILKAVQSIEKANSNGRIFNQRSGLTGRANLIKTMEADMDFNISLEYDDQRNIPLIKYGRSTQEFGELDQHLNLATQVIETHSLEAPLLEIKRRGINSRAFHIRSMLFSFKPLVQQNVNYLSSPLYFKFDLVAHNSINLRTIQPSYVEQNQARDFRFSFPKIGQQIDTVSADIEEWVPITDQNILAQINRVILSATLPSGLVDPSAYFKTPLWTVHIKLTVDILGDEINGEIRNELIETQQSINDFINNNSN